jgi:hypothetical protein
LTDFANNIEPVAVYLSLALETLVIVRLAQLRIARRYRFFALYAAADIVRTVVLLLATDLNWRGLAYLQLWLATVPLIWITLPLATFELFGLIHDEFPGEPTRTKLSAASLVLGTLIAFGLSAITIGPVRLDRHPIYQAGLLIHRAIFFGCALLVLAQALFFLLADAKLPRNLQAHRILLTAFVLSLAGKAFFAPGAAKDLTAWANSAQEWFGCLCFLGWLFYLTSAGETAPDITPISTAELAEIVQRYEDRFGR